LDAADAITHIPRLRRYARLLVGDAARADDLVQDTLERACRKWALWRPPGAPGADVQAALRAWLLALMHNLHANQWRQSAAHPTTELDAALEPRHDPTPATGVRLDLERALALLPTTAREVLLLVAVEQCSYAETAETLGVPIGTVMSRLARAREQLRQLMDGGAAAPAARAALKVVK